MNIRKVELSDAVQIAEIYNYYITSTHQTFESEPLSVEETERRISVIVENYPFLVAEEDGEIYGYANATKFRLQFAYEHTAEVSVYVKNEAKQKGIGTKLYTALFDEIAETNIHAMVAGIALPNEPSVKFHIKQGFSMVAHFREIGYKLGRWVDVTYWQLMNRI